MQWNRSVRFVMHWRGQRTPTLFTIHNLAYQGVAAIVVPLAYLFAYALQRTLIPGKGICRGTSVRATP